MPAEQQKGPMRDRVKWTVLALVALTVFALTFMKAPAAITAMLQEVAADVRAYSLVVHGLVLAVVALGLLARKSRTILFSALIAYLSLSATIVSLKYLIAPNIILFGVFFALIVHAYFTKQLGFDFERVAPPSLFFGVLGLVFGFWYLHWVDSPVWLNAALYSPLGAVNCPTMLIVAGFLCLSRRPGAAMLEAFVGLITLYFGLFGIFMLGAYVDVALVLCGLFLLVRLASQTGYMGVFGKTKRGAGLTLQ